MGKRIKVEGDKKLIKKLLRLADRKTIKKINRKATNVAATPLVKAVKRNVPVDTGLLKKAIAKKLTAYVRSFSYNAIVGADVGVRATDEDGNEYIPANIDHLVEYGFAHPGGTHVPARSFLRKGWEEGIGDAQKRLNAKLKEEIEKAASK